MHTIPRFHSYECAGFFLVLSLFLYVCINDREIVLIYMLSVDKVFSPYFNLFVVRAFHSHSFPVSLSFPFCFSVVNLNAKYFFRAALYILSYFQLIFGISFEVFGYFTTHIAKIRSFIMSFVRNRFMSSWKSMELWFVKQQQPANQRRTKKKKCLYKMSKRDIYENRSLNVPLTRSRNDMDLNQSCKLWKSTRKYAAHKSVRFNFWHLIHHTLTHSAHTHTHMNGSLEATHIRNLMMIASMNEA